MVAKPPSTPTKKSQLTDFHFELREESLIFLLDNFTRTMMKLYNIYLKIIQPTLILFLSLQTDNNYFYKTFKSLIP
ncbi:MAG: hypothetical protein AUJ98_11430 [Bacteroidetes bacterium CG2_30_33_31]|nr:MAG: hypothetical protein AUJ98_11430 [Bacteroidetes bacterium CG2_30_33_31]